ncbi:MAG: SDR family oxidoreductase [Novosphingobium sp.]|nr:SDR family oxidoreductase [Novosphingobium sp.]
MAERELEGRRIIVTGAGSGMGRAIATLFAEHGARQTLFDINADGLAALQIDNADTMVVDMANRESVLAATEAAATAMGSIDGLVNAAGILRVVPFAETTPDVWHEVMGVNLHGPYYLCHAALPHLKQADKATIVNISSLAGLIAPEGMTAYAATKAGLIGLTRVLAADLGPRIRANAIAPGVIKTAMTLGMVQGSSSGVDEMGLGNMMRRPGTPEEIAELALFLSSERSSFINGTTTAIDGGASWH